MIVIANVLQKLQTVKNLDNSLKIPVSEHALKHKMWKRPKYLPNFHESAFIMFIIILIEFDL